MSRTVQKFEKVDSDGGKISKCFMHRIESFQIYLVENILSI